MKIALGICIDDNELEERFVRSSGPGGQNVNKVSTAVELRFDLAGNQTLPESVKRRLHKLAGRRLTQDGILVIQSDRFRTQDMNRSDVREKLRNLLAQSLVAPRKRIKTKPTRSSKEKRIKAKQVRGQVKKLRGRNIDLS